MLLLAALAFAGPPPADPVEARLAGPLRGLVRGADVVAWASDRPEPLDPEVGSVVVEGAPDLGDRLARAGWAVEAEAGGRVQVRLRWEELRALAATKGVTRVREPWRARPKEVLGEGWDAVMARDWHEEGVKGKGARVAVVDVGFTGWEALERSELPGGVDTWFEAGDPEATAHGAAVAEVVADFAPDADLILASFSTDVEFCELAERLVEAEVDVVNGSIGFDNVWHADGTSSLTVCADWMGENGIFYSAAAGNENDKYRVGALSYAADGTTVRIAGLDEVDVGTWGGWADVSFRWSEPFGGAREDLELILFNRDGSECGRSEDTQDGEGWPYEYVSATGCSDTVRAVVYSIDGAASLDGLEGYLYGTWGMDESAWTWTEDLTLPGDLNEGVSVGAFYPRDGSAPDYASRGPTNDGRDKPDLAAPTGVSTATYGTLGFEGTSAAAPHAAGVGALWVSATRRRGEPDALRAWMLDEAVDLGEPGPDLIFGAGALHADTIPEGKGLACGCAAGTGSAGATPLLLLLALLGRRRA